jgi:hypothetical protein
MPGMMNNKPKNYPSHYAKINTNTYELIGESSSIPGAENIYYYWQEYCFTGCENRGE